MAPTNRRISNRVLALGSAAVVAVYAAGFARTRAAAARVEASARRPAVVPTVARAAEAAVTASPAPIMAPVRRSKPTLVSKKSRGVVSAPVAAAAKKSPEVISAPPAAAAAEPAPPAPAPAPQPAPAALPPPEPEPQFYFKDGTYLGWGTSRHGDIQAQVVIANGRIASATIAQCRTQYSCDVIAKLPGQVVKRQSPEVDYVTGATQSVDAFYWAVVDALNKAKQL